MKATVFAVVAILAVGVISGLRFQKNAIPDNPPLVVIKPSAAPKSLVERWNEEATFLQHAAYAFKRPYRDPPFQPLAFYAGSESHDNLIAERTRGGRLAWGPMALDTPYDVVWRGAGEVHIRVPGGATEAQISEWRVEIERCEPGALVRVNPQSSTFPTSETSETPQ